MATPPAPDVVAPGAVRWLAVAGGAVSAITGVILAFAYRPGRLGWLRAAHSSSAGIAIVSFIAWAVVRRQGKVRPSVRGVAVVLGLAIVIGGAFATGPGLAWDGGDGSSRGVVVGSGHGVKVDGRLVTSGDLLVTLLVHVVLAVCTAAAFTWHYRRSK